VREADYYRRLEVGAQSADWALARWADGSGQKSPFDFVGCDPFGLAVGLEMKIERAAGGIRLGESWPAQWFKEREHQLNWLERYRQAGAWSLVLVGEKATGNWWLFRYEPEVALEELVVVQWMPGCSHMMFRALTDLRARKAMIGVRPIGPRS
jgi:hypothetical protein